MNNRIENIKNKINNLSLKSISSNKLSQLQKKITDLNKKGKPSRSLFESAQKVASGMGTHLKGFLNTTQQLSEHPIVNKMYSYMLGIGIILLSIVIYFFMDKVNKHLELVLKNLLVSLVLFAISSYGVPSIMGDNNLLGQIVIIVFLTAATFMFIMFVRALLTYYRKHNEGAPFLINGTQSGKNSMVIPQDPNNPESIIVYRSDDEDGGLEFSYDFWIIIDNFSYRTTDMKHVFHKGDGKAEVNMCPGVWLLPNKNTMRIYINTFKDKDNYLDIENFPLDKWVHVSLVVKQKLIQVYVNGFLKHSKQLDSVPRQNFGNVWVNLFGGFDGFISNLRYHNRCIDYSEIMSTVKKGPSSAACGLKGDTPPYLSTSWWLS